VSGEPVGTDQPQPGVETQPTVEISPVVEAQPVVEPQPAINLVIYDNPEDDPRFVMGGEGNDTYYHVISRDSRDFFIGGAGLDVLHLVGNSDQFTLHRLALDEYWITSKTWTPESEFVATFGVEEVVFGDGVSLVLDIAPSGDGTSGDDTLYAGPSGSNIDGGDGNDQIYGHAGDDHLTGGDGDDLIVCSTSGNDVLYGGGGRDHLLGYTKGSVLFGGDGDDLLRGNASIMTGDAGADIFEVDTRERGTSIVADFTLGEDKLWMEEGYVVVHPWSAVQDGADAVVTAGAAVVVLKNIDASLLSADNFFSY
jgi:Ca2+-binding RTX toxin-like protein